MTAVWNARGLPHTSKLVLLALADNANDAGICWPSIPKVAERCSLDERTVYRAIATLEGCGHVTTQARPGKSTVYKVHPRQPDTPDKPSPLTNSQDCQKVTPVTESGTPVSLSGPPTSEVLLTSSGSEPSRTLRKSSLRSPRAPARARSRTVPEDFAITPEMRKWAKEAVPNVDVDAQTLIFRDHEFKDPHGNWPAAWRQWMRRAPEFQRGSNANGNAEEPKLTWRPPPDDGPHNVRK